MKTGCRSMMIVWVTLLVLVSSVLLAGGAEEVVRVYGASTYAELIQGLGKAFMTERPNVRVQVIGRSSEFGFLALLHKESDLVMATRKATVVERSLAERKGVRLMGNFIGWESVAVICHPGVGVTELTVDQLRKIYKGDYKNWSELGGADQPIKLHSPAHPQGDVMVWFLRTVLSKADFTSGIIWVESAQFLVRHVSIHPGAVAYLGNLQLTSVLKRNPQFRVQVLRIRANSESPALGPSPEVSRKGDYPLTIPLFLYWNKNNPDRRVEEFSQFCAEKLQEPAEN